MLYLTLLYAYLADPVYECRESAERVMRHMVDRHPSHYGPRLGELVRGATCPEVRCRAVRVLRVYDRWRVNSYVPPVPVWPCIDCLAVANPCIPFGLVDARDKSHTGRWLCACPPCTVEPGPYWGRYRAATERMIRDRLREGWDAEQCDALLMRAWAVEQGCRADCTAETWSISSRWQGWAGGYPRPAIESRP